MSSDDLTRNKQETGDDDKETQPTITAVFRLIQGVESRLNARIDESEGRLNARLDGLESRLAHDIEGVNARVTEVNARVTEVNMRVTEVNTRVTEGFKDLTHKINAMNRRALQADADYEDLSERIERLESKAL